MDKVSRRSFLRSTAAASGMLLGLEGLVARGAFAATTDRHVAPNNGGYGPLIPTPAQNIPATFLALPPGFAYTVFGQTGTLMADGNPTPPAHDGMAAFAVGSLVRLVRNHEVRTRVGTQGAAIGGLQSYDPLAGGGTTTLLIDPMTRLPTRSFVSLSGTETNCAGGPTPWGSWLSCEETTAGPSQGFSKPHGYIFEVPAASDGVVQPTALRAMGRFVHEAVAVDPATGIVYETEDRGTAGFYRFLPDNPGNLAAGGRLQMLAIKNRSRYDTRTGQRVGVEQPVTWVDIADPDPALAETDDLAVYKQGRARGGATFARLEGCWYGNGNMYLNSTSGGNIGKGQVWQYTPRGKNGGTLTLLFESPDAAVLDAPDNLCVSPRGGLVLCEDGEGEQFVRGLTPSGLIFDVAQNLVLEENGPNEFAGATFSPDGQTLFVNIQTPGMTFAIWGPWEKGTL